MKNITFLMKVAKHLRSLSLWERVGVRVRSGARRHFILKGRSTRPMIVSADERLIEAARNRARTEHTTLNEQFRLWLENHALHRERMADYDRLMTELRGKVRIGRKLTRDELTER